MRAVRAYRLLPEVAAQVVGAGLPMVEVLLGILLLVGAGVRAGAAISAVLMLAFLIGIGSAWARGLQIDCGCFGGGGQAGADATRYLRDVGRDGLFLWLAVLVAAGAPSRLALDNLARD